MGAEVIAVEARPGDADRAAPRAADRWDDTAKVSEDHKIWRELTSLRSSRRATTP